MSRQPAKQERSKAKDLRQQQAPDKPSTGRKRKKVKKPWVIQQRLTEVGLESTMGRVWERKGWHKYKAYAKEEDALINLKKLNAERYSLWWEYRVVNIEGVSFGD